jgi:hypothetical protein
MSGTPTHAPGLSSLPVEALHPNDYNPNRMTEAEFAELVAEVRHLGRQPKPVIVRPDGDGYAIVDGEHGWRAAREVGSAEVPCEVIDADDFEAMRQTYKRNQHGTHDPVLLGRMFRRMVEARGISRRELAAEMDVSEGSVRNALLYADAADLRNSYAASGSSPWSPELDKPDERIAKLAVRQAREYAKLPPPIRDIWLNAGADLKLLAEAGRIRLEIRGVKRDLTIYDPDDDPGRHGMSEDESVGAWRELVEAGLDAHLQGTRSGFVASARKAWQFLEWRREHGPAFDPYLQIVAELRFVTPAVLGSLPCREVEGHVLPLISPERWKRILLDMDRAGPTGGERLAILNAGRALALREVGADPDDVTDPRAALRLGALGDAPPFIRDADISTEQKMALAAAKPPFDVPGDVVLEAKRLAVELLQRGWQRIRSGATASLAEQLMAPVRSPSAVRADPNHAFDDCLKTILAERRSAALDSVFARSGPLLGTTLDHLRQRYTFSNEATWQALGMRLGRLPHPELTLLAAFVLGDEKAAMKRWHAAMQATAEETPAPETEAEAAEPVGGEVPA